MAIDFINVHFDSEEIPIEHNNDNVYTDGEFNIKIPKNSSLVSMPNMTWTQVGIHTFSLTDLTRFGQSNNSYPKTLFCFLGKNTKQISILQTSLGVREIQHIIYRPKLAHHSQQGSTQ